MLIAVPKEIKAQEARVGLLPGGVAELAAKGHQLLVESGAGRHAGAPDEAYEAAGARICDSAEELFEKAQLIIKVKEPQQQEWERLRPDHILFTYLHLAADPAQATGLLASGCTAIAYETVTDASGGLPLLAPMSEIAGRLAVLDGAQALKAETGGCGLLATGVPGVAAANIVILGGGMVGSNAARVAAGIGGRVTILDKSLPRLRQLTDIFGSAVTPVYASQQAVAEAVQQADMVIGAVLVPGAAAPHLVSRVELVAMRPGAVLVDVAIDQGGCFETSRPTTHAEPTYLVDGIVHYCVANMPGAVPLTASAALTHAILPFVHHLADNGLAALAADPHLAAGLNVQAGKLTHPAVIAALGQMQAA